MLDIVKMSEELKCKLQSEADTLINDRLTMRDVLQSRSRELSARRDAELTRVDSWASDQRKLIQEIFSALLAETEHDRLKNDDCLTALMGDIGAEATIPAYNASKSISRSNGSLKAAQ